MKRTTLYLLTFAIGLMVVERVATAQQPVGQPTNLILIQDEDKELSRVQTVFYSAEREASIQLLVMGAVEMGRDATLVTVIGPSGVMDQISSDGRPLVKFNNVEPGLHAIVASSESTHGTTLVNFQPKEQDDVADPADEKARGETTTPTRMTLAVTSARELRPFVDRIRDLEANVADSEFVDLTDSRESFNYRVALRRDGTLTGRVYTVLRNSAAVSLDGTQIGIFHQGDPVASTTCDENGDWKIPNFESGVYGLIAAGPAGYTAFAFSVSANAGEIAVDDLQGQKLVSKIQPKPAFLPELLPVVLVPPSMCSAVVEAITQTYPILNLRTDVAQSPFGFPVGGTMVAPTSAAGAGVPGASALGGGAFGEGAFGGSAGAGIGGLTGLAGFGALIQATNQQQTGQGIQTPPIASPSFPQTGGSGGF